MEKRILLIDDDSDDAEIFQEALESTGLSAVFEYMSDGYVACETLMSGKSMRPDLIFLDINMPTFDGWSCLMAIKRDPGLRNIPVIMYSTAAHDSDRHRAIDLGAIALLTKPSSFKDLRNKLIQIIPQL